ncbi:MAG: threonine dehydratase [Saprospiraceae bacterium]|jgi:threonine dehydratase
MPTTSSLIPIRELQKARLALDSIVDRTPLHLNAGISKKYKANIYLKREDLQNVRSFKIRGAYYKMSTLTAEERINGIVCASAGNHAQGVAMACAKLDIQGTIFMPTTTPNQKITRVDHFGEGKVEIRLTGDTFDDSNITAREYATLHGKAFIHPFDDPDVIAGQGTVAIEVIEDIKVPIDYLIVTVGGGGLIAGMASYFKVLSPQTKIIAVEAEGAPSLLKAMEAGKVVKLESIDGFADGIATKSVGQIPLDICKESVDQHILVAEGKMCVTILSLYNEEAIVVEPACAAAIAALDNIADDIKGKNVVCVLSGGNNDITRTEEIKERAMLFEGKKHYFIVKFPQRAGALREFLDLLGPNDDIARFEYTKKTNRGSGPALVGIELKDVQDFKPLVTRMKAADIDFQHLNESPLLFEMLV